MSALIKLNDGRIEKHTLCLAMAMEARKEGKIVDGSYHATVARKKRLAKAAPEVQQKRREDR